MVDFKELWSVLDWAVIIIYFALIIIVGVVMNRRANTSFKSFFIASRRLTVPIIVGTALAGWYDSWTIVGLAECGATMGICIILINTMPAAIFRLPLALWIGPFARDKVPDWVVTMPDLIGYFYDRKTKLLATIEPTLGIAYSAAIMFVVGDVLHLITGIHIIITMVFIGLVIIFYTYLAGLWALAVTDLIQFVFMTISGGFIGFGIMTHFGGVQPIWDAMASMNPDSVTLTGGLPFTEMIGWAMGGIAMYTSAQSYQRFGAARGGSDIRAAYAITCFVGFSFCMIMVLSGMASATMYPDVYQDNFTTAYWGTVFTLLPPGVRGIMVAALISAVMSTMSADLLISAGIFTNDVVKEFFIKNMTDAQKMKWTRGFIVVLGLLSTIITYFWADGIDKAWYYIGGFTVAVFLVPIVGAMFYKKKTVKGGWIAVSTSILFYILWQFVLQSPANLDTNCMTWIFCAVVFFIACNVTYDREQKKVQMKEEVQKSE